jgi:hypothetical protein
MANPTLDSIEKQHRKTIRALNSGPGPSLLKIGVAGAIFTPFLIVELLFVPILGQVLFLIAAAVTLGYFRAARSFAAPLVGISSGLASFVGLTALASAFEGSSAGITHTVMALSTILSVIYIGVVTGAFYLRDEEAADRYQAALSDETGTTNSKINP